VTTAALTAERSGRAERTRADRLNLAMVDGQAEGEGRGGKGGRAQPYVIIRWNVIRSAEIDMIQGGGTGASGVPEKRMGRAKLRRDKGRPPLGPSTGTRPGEKDDSAGVGADCRQSRSAGSRLRSVFEQASRTDTAGRCECAGRLARELQGSKLPRLGASMRRKRVLHLPIVCGSSGRCVDLWLCGRHVNFNVCWPWQGAVLVSGHLWGQCSHQSHHPGQDGFSKISPRTAAIDSPLAWCR
jgi:hypothetical protein